MRTSFKNKQSLILRLGRAGIPENYISIISRLLQKIKCVLVYDLVSHGKNTTGQNECYGTYDSNTGTGYGPAYMNSCIHTSNTTENNIVDTVWYNYTLASAGTIIDKNTTSSNPANNMNTATESVCPSGWALPTTKQIDNNKDITSFNPVLGGYYVNGTLDNENTRGGWWGSTAYNGASRYALRYDGSSLYTSYGLRHRGCYVRCVSEEKTVTDLTYLQDMTGEIADNTLDGTTAN